MSTDTTKKRKTTDDLQKEMPTKAISRVEELERELLETKKELAKAKETIRDLESKVKQEEAPSDDEGEEEDSTDPWNLKFIELRQYRLLNGHCRVPQRNSPNPSLGNWLLSQKKAFKSKKLSPERIPKLESLGVVWGKSFPAPVPWEDRFHSKSSERFGMPWAIANLS
jgi:septal ring factor EnvC (AmiA/AmiB activator)